MSKPRFSGAHRRRAVNAYLSGMRMKQVCDAFGVPRQTVRLWVLSAGHEMRGAPTPQSSLSSDQIERVLGQVRLEHAGGKSTRELGSEYGVSRATILKWLKGESTPRSLPHKQRPNLMPRMRPSFRTLAERKKFRAEVQTLFAEGRSKMEIARRYNVSDTTVRRWLTEWAEIKVSATPAAAVTKVELVIPARADGRGHWPAGKPRSAISSATQEKQRASLLKMIADGCSRREIARQLDVSEKTVRRWLSGGAIAVELPIDEGARE